MTTASVMKGLKTSLEHILSTIILILIYLPRYNFFLILFLFINGCPKKLFSKTSSHLVISPLICIANQLTCFYKIQILTERYIRTDVSILKYVLKVTAFY